MSQTRSSDVAWVAGATGYTGRAVVARLAAQGAEVHAHVRPNSSGLEKWKREFTALGAIAEVVAWEPAAIEEALRRVAPTQVYALLGTTVARAKAAERAGEAPADCEKVDVGLTLMLLNACRTLSRSPRFVYLSSAGVHPHARGAYLQARARVEDELRESGVPYTIARPSFITGPDRDESRPLERAGAAVSDAALSVLGAFGAKRLAARYRSTTNVTLAAALVRAAGDPAAENRVLESEQLRVDGAEAKLR